MEPTTLAGAGVAGLKVSYARPAGKVSVITTLVSAVPPVFAKAMSKYVEAPGASNSFATVFWSNVAGVKKDTVGSK